MRSRWRRGKRGGGLLEEFTFIPVFNSIINILEIDSDNSNYNDEDGLGCPSLCRGRRGTTSQPLIVGFGPQSTFFNV